MRSVGSGMSDVTDRLVHALGDPAWWVRVRSVQALEQIGPAAEQPLLAALDNTHREIRGRAAITLERLGAATTLAAAIRNDDDASLQPTRWPSFRPPARADLIDGIADGTDGACTAGDAASTSSTVDVATSLPRSHRWRWATPIRSFGLEP